MSEERFKCVDCGEMFASLSPPAETRSDDPEPRCSDCIEAMLDTVESEPLTDEEIVRIVWNAAANAEEGRDE